MSTSDVGDTETIANSPTGYKRPYVLKEGAILVEQFASKIDVSDKMAYLIAIQMALDQEGNPRDQASFKAALTEVNK